MNGHFGSGRALHGPLSVLGAILGLLVASVAFLGHISGTTFWVFLSVAPALGLLLLLSGPGLVRQVGIGLVASGIAYPVGFSAVIVAALINS